MLRSFGSFILEWGCSNAFKIIDVSSTRTFIRGHMDQNSAETWCRGFLVFSLWILMLWFFSTEISMSCLCAFLMSQYLNLVTLWSILSDVMTLWTTLSNVMTLWSILPDVMPLRPLKLILGSRCGAFNVSVFWCRGFLSSYLDVSIFWTRNLDDVVFQSWDLQIMDLCGSSALSSVENLKWNFCENYTKLSKFMRQLTAWCTHTCIRNVIYSMINDLLWRLLEKSS